MTTTLPTRERRHDHPPHPTTTHRPVRPVGLLDRLALRLGLLLITYGRREHALSREQHAARRAQVRDAERREREAARTLLLLTLQR